MDCIETAFLSYELVFLYSRIVSDFNIVISKAYFRIAIRLSTSVKPNRTPFFSHIKWVSLLIIS